MITTAAAIITVLLVIAIFVLPCRYLLVPFVLTACFVPADQHISLFSLHFYVNRILIFTAIFRIFAMGEARPVKWNRLDKLVLTWAVVGAAIYILRRHNLQGMIYKSGVLVDILGLYWITRQTTRSWDDIKRVLLIFGVCMIVLVPFVAMEWATGVNPFLFMGAISTLFREGAFRCMASWRHPIVAGAFVVCLVPLFIAMAQTDRRKLFYWLAAAACVFIAIASHSSTPIGGLGAILFFVAMYRYRQYGRHMTWAFFGSLVFLHLVMNGPVWSLLFKVTIISGSTGYHRFVLIDAAIRHFTEWMLLGTDDTGSWGYYLFDVTNHFVLEGVRGGALTLGLFVTVLVVAVRTTAGFSRQHIPRDHQWLSWALCTSILGHCIMFIGLGYFGQIEILLYMTFAFAGFVYEQNALVSKARQVRPAGAIRSPAVVAGCSLPTR